jgi:hypothetical protein
MDKETIKQQQLKHLNSIVETYHGAVSSAGEDAQIPEVEAYRIVIRARNTVDKICDDTSPYSQEVERVWREDFHIGYKAKIITGILMGLRDEISDGLLDSLPALVRRDLFDSYLVMAEYLLNEGYKDPAAVIVGGSLETHLRQMASMFQIETHVAETHGKVPPKRAEVINQELGKSGVYSMLDQKQITAWLDLRNNAAHGKYSAYSDTQVKQFIEWLKDFIEKHPA